MKNLFVRALVLGLTLTIPTVALAGDEGGDKPAKAEKKAKKGKKGKKGDDKAPEGDKAPAGDKK